MYMLTALRDVGGTDLCGGKTAAYRVHKLPFCDKAGQSKRLKTVVRDDLPTGL